MFSSQLGVSTDGSQWDSPRTAEILPVLSLHIDLCPCSTLWPKTHRCLVQSFGHIIFTEKQRGCVQLDVTGPTFEFLYNGLNHKHAPPRQCLHPRDS